MKSGEENRGNAVLVEAGNCVYCGRHIDNGDYIFLCEECRRKEEGCLHEERKVVGISTVRPERPTMVKEPKRKPKGKEEQ